MKKFEISPGGFLYGGEPVQLICGAIHYFRVLPQHWEDRLVKLKACGLNAVETYVPWNAHEPSPGVFTKDGILDFVRFIRLAEAYGLMVVVRPSPYICAEWEFGGLPAWLLADPDLQVRCMYQPFLAAVDRYYDWLLPQLAPLQCTAGGPVVMMQIENEYGSFGNDRAYLAWLERAMQRRGIEVPLFTSDGPSDGMLQGGGLPHVFKTVNFGSQSAEAFHKLREYQPDGPLVCMEFWNGWFDHWREQHHVRAAEDAALCLDEMLAVGASVNMYMFHGGTNFGFSSGANCDPVYAPTVTSYDYDAPLNEAGDPTEKYFAYRDVIARHRELPQTAVPSPSRKAHYGRVGFTQQAGLFDSLPCLATPVFTNAPETMEKLGQSSGFILYRTHVSGPRAQEQLVIQDVHDRALVFLNGRLQGVRYRGDLNSPALPVDIPTGGARLDILVENMGRINYGPHLVDRKGITTGVRLNNQFLFGWETYRLPLDNLWELTYSLSGPCEEPAFHRAEFEIDQPADTFVALDGWTKGICFINGFNLGRYWNVEPHRNLYLPGPLLKPGCNEIVVFELHMPAQELFITLTDSAEAHGDRRAPLRETERKQSA